jgi:SAM-dependent methyltransferase
MEKDFTKLQGDFSKIQIMQGLNAWDFLTLCRDRHHALYRRLSPSRVPAEKMARLYAGMADLSTHFESRLEGGRGDSFREAQNKNYLIRSVGYLRLLDLALGGEARTLDHLVVLDALGGNGTLTRIVRASRTPEETPYIVTSDVSARMIESALGQQLPAIRQPVQEMVWFDDCTFDAVIIAYGTHHIPPDERAKAVAEAYRVLKPGGRIVLQDFEIGSPTAEWYDNVLDRYTLTGHKFEYFTREQFRNLLAGNSFAEIEILDIYDPFILFADDPKEARLQLLDFVFTLFGLEKLLPSDGKRDRQFWDQLEIIVRQTSTFEAAKLAAAGGTVREFTVQRDGSRYRAEIPRICLAGVGRKPRQSGTPPKLTPAADPRNEIS